MEDAPAQDPAPWLADMQDWLKMRPRQVQGCCFLAAESLAAAHPDLRVVHGAAGNQPLEYWLSGGVFTRYDLVGCSWKDTPEKALKGALSGLAEELEEQARLDVERAAKLRKLAGEPQ